MAAPPRRTYFNPNNPDWPDKVEIPIVMPKLLEDAFATHDAAREAIQAKLDELVRKAHHDNATTGKGYAGAKRVMKTPHTHRASSNEPFGRRHPTFAAAGNPEVARKMVEQRGTFLSAYQKAWLAWKAGDHAAIFPAGTWKMRVYHAARTDPWHGPPLAA